MPFSLPIKTLGKIFVNFCIPNPLTLNILKYFRGKFSPTQKINYRRKVWQTNLQNQSIIIPLTRKTDMSIRSFM